MRKAGKPWAERQETQEPCLLETGWKEEFKKEEA